MLGADNLASLSTYVYQDVMLSQINFGLGNAAAVFMFLCAFLASLFFALVLRAQASTGLAHSGLQRDAPMNGGGTIAGRRYGRSGRALGVIGGMLSALFLAPLAWVFWVSVAHASGAGEARSRVRRCSPTPWSSLILRSRRDWPTAPS